MCIQREDNSDWSELWLVRYEDTGRLSLLRNGSNDGGLKRFSALEQATNFLLTNETRPLPYQLLTIATDRDRNVDGWTATSSSAWSDVTELDRLREIAKSVRIVSFEVLEQTSPKSRSFHRARAVCLTNKNMWNKYAGVHDVACEMTSLTGVTPTLVKVTVQEEGKHSSQTMTADRSLRFIEEDAEAHNNVQNMRLTVYKVHLNEKYARSLLKRLVGVLRPNKKCENHCYWNTKNRVTLDHPVFRFAFHTDPALSVCDPCERLLLEYYTGLPCETGPLEASSPSVASYMYRRLLPSSVRDVTEYGNDEESSDGSGSDSEDGDAIRPESESEDIISSDMADVPDESVDTNNNAFRVICVFDYSMFYPHLVAALYNKQKAIRNRLNHMTAAREEFRDSSLKSFYTKELGGLRLVPGFREFHEKMVSFGQYVLKELVLQCKAVGLTVVMTQKDSVTVLVPQETLSSYCSPENIAGTLEANVRKKYTNFASPLKVERCGDAMLFFHSNKHVLYRKDEMVKATGMFPKTLCSAVLASIDDILRRPLETRNELFGGEENQTETSLLAQRLRKLAKTYAVGDDDLLSESVGLSTKCLLPILYAMPGEDNMFREMPLLFYNHPPTARFPIGPPESVEWDADRRRGRKGTHCTVERVLGVLLRRMISLEPKQRQALNKMLRTVICPQVCVDADGAKGEQPLLRTEKTAILERHIEVAQRFLLKHRRYFCAQ